MFITSLLPFLRQVWARHHPLLLGLLLGFVGPWFVFVRLAREVWEGEGLPGDQAILRWLHAHATPLLDAVALGVTHAGGPLGAPVLAGLIGLAFWLLTRSRRALLFYSLAIGGAELLNLAAKYLLARTRPSLWVSLAPETSYSFPSGHSMAAAALAATLGLLLWRTRWRGVAVGLGLVWALGMGWSRLYLGVHYPSDVLAGWVGSVGWVSGLYLLFSRYHRELGQVWHEWQDRASLLRPRGPANHARLTPPGRQEGRDIGSVRRRRSTQCGSRSG